MNEETTKELSPDSSPDIAEQDFKLVEEDWFEAGQASGAYPPEEDDSGPGDTPEDDDDADAADTQELPKQEANQSFKLKYMGQEIDVSRDEMIMLAQKGKDYDRIRSRADALSSALQENSAGKLQPETLDPTARRDRDVAEFLTEYRSVDPRSIPGEVWESVKTGKSLLGAYQRYENRLLKAQVDAQRKNLDNRLKTAGSRATGGAVGPRGEVENDWFNND